MSFQRHMRVEIGSFGITDKNGRSTLPPCYRPPQQSRPVMLPSATSSARELSSITEYYRRICITTHLTKAFSHRGKLVKHLHNRRSAQRHGEPVSPHLPYGVIREVFSRILCILHNLADVAPKKRAVQPSSNIDLYFNDDGRLPQRETWSRNPLPRPRRWWRTSAFSAPLSRRPSEIRTAARSDSGCGRYIRYEGGLML
jgi:hypothetical protein